MKKKLDPFAIFYESELKRRDLKRSAVTAILCAAVALAWHFLPPGQVDPAEAILERTLLASCRLPDVEGSATLFLRFNDKSFCWRFH